MGRPDPKHDQQRVADAAALVAVVHRTGELAWRLERIRKWLVGPEGEQLASADILCLDEAITHFRRLHATLERRSSR